MSREFSTYSESLSPDPLREFRPRESAADGAERAAAAWIVFFYLGQQHAFQGCPLHSTSLPKVGWVPPLVVVASVECGPS